MKFWRTLIRVCKVDESNFYVAIPGRGYDEMVCINLDSIPNEIRNMIEPNKRLHAQVNIGVEDANELIFRDWETE